MEGHSPALKMQAIRTLLGWMVLVAGLLALPEVACADISDSGNLTIGNQGVIQGTMTVVGNAFSVGGSSFAVNAGNVGIGTTSPTSMLTIQNGNIRISTTTGSYGIIFQDGSTQIAASGAGTAVLSATQTFTGTNAFSNNVTVASTMTITGNAFSVGGSTLSISNGQVGINTTNPLSTARLDINGNINMSNATSIFTTSSGLLLIQPGTTLFLRDTSSSGININDSDAGNVIIATGGGKAGVGTASPAYELDVAGSAHATSFPTSSDIRLKENIRPLDNALQKLKGIKAVSFDWNDKYKKLGRAIKGRQIGLIAQEVEKEFPELVSKWKAPELLQDGKHPRTTTESAKLQKWTEYRGLDYGRFTAVLLEAIQEQQKEIEELQAEVKKSQGVTK